MICVSPVTWGTVVDQPTHKLVIPQHLTGAHGQGLLGIIEQSPAATWSPLNKHVVAPVATAAVMQHHPSKVVGAAPPIVKRPLGAELSHGKLYGILHAGNGLHDTMLLVPLHDMQTV